MKTTTIQIVLVIAMIFVTSIFSINAQDSNFFFDRKEENGKLISKVKYELTSSGLFEKTEIHEYSYNEAGALSKETVSKWNTRKSDWEPEYCITHNYNMPENTVILEYSTWNKKGKRYDEAKEKVVYNLDESGNIISWSIIDGNNNTEKYTAYNAIHITSRNLATIL